MNAILFLLFSVGNSQNTYFVDKHISCNNVYGVAQSKQNTEYVQYLGSFDSTTECINACINASKSNDKCLTYTYHTSSLDSSFAKQCFGRFNYPLWLPYKQDNINCGQIIWECVNESDCSLNGICNKETKNCSCNTGWNGYRCNQLNLLSVDKTSGYNQNINNKHTSSWGGSPIYDYTTNKYHMIVSEIVNNCGMSSWQINSRIIDVEATNGYNSKYDRIQVLEIPFAHEPNILKGPNNEYIIYYTHYNYGNEYPPCTLCTDGSTPPKCNIPNNPLYIESMIYSTSKSLINATWSKPLNVLNNKNGELTQDDNLAAVILKNGTVIGMSRYWDNNGCSSIHLVTANNWKMNNSYNQHDDYLFPELSGMCTEDPFLWIDCTGYYHAFFHNMDPMRYIGLDGAHAFSMDGVNWIYGGYSFGDFVTFTDGTTMTLGSRERPHIIFDEKDGCTPVALTNGVVYDGGEYHDQSYTFLQPIAH